MRDHDRAAADLDGADCRLRDRGPLAVPVLMGRGGDLRNLAGNEPRGPHFSLALFGPLNPTRAVTSPAWCFPLDRDAIRG
jgi:hypothetical protein